MLPFKVGAIVLCDDIRQEQNSKYILVGVYNNSIIVAAFPTEIALSWWIQVLPEKVGKFAIDLQIVKDGAAILARGEFGFDVTAPDWSIIALPRIGLQLQSEGKLKMQLKTKDTSDWETVQEFTVKTL